MNQQYIGSTATLTSIDLCFQICKAFNLPLWYVSLLTEPRERSKGDKNATNYRIGTQNKSLHELMKSIFFAEDSSINDVFNYLSVAGINLKAVATRNNAKAGHYRMGYMTNFSHKDRKVYFEEFGKHIEQVDQVIYLEPDSGVSQSGKKLNSAKGDAYILPGEVKTIADATTENSIIIIRQMLNNHLYTHEARIKDMNNELGANVILLADEVTQAGVYVICKSSERFQEIISRMEYYISDYRFLKNSSRILLGIATGHDLVMRSIGNFSIDETEEKPEVTEEVTPEV